jgi:DNA-binding NarL/FixJ family response regulator
MTSSISHSTSPLRMGTGSEQEEPNLGGQISPQGARPLSQQAAKPQSRQLRRDPLHEQNCPNRATTDPPCGLELALRERIKGMSCLYGISHLVEKYDNREEQILQGIVNLLPPSWQYPDCCCARLVLQGREYRSPGFRRSPWPQSASVRADGKTAGVLEVFYLEEMPDLDEGPFLKAERDLIDAVAERTGRILERIGVERQLKGDQAALRERLKELRCLYKISQLAEQHADSLPDLLLGIVRLLPPSWQYPEICQARLTLYDESYETEGFRESISRQAAPIRVQGENAGSVEVVYLEERPDLIEGPFLREERDLIDAIAERIGKMVEHFQVEQQSKVDRSALREANAALKRVLGQIEDEKTEIREAVHANVDKILMPTLRALASEIPAQQKGYVTLLQRQLNELASPFVTKLSKAFSSLTPAEIEICDMIRSGMSTKEIAGLRHVAPATVSKQRERIRRKLNLSQTDANLTTHLLMLAAERGGAAGGGPSELAILY